LSLLSPLDEDLVVAYPPLMPIRLLELLAERGVAIVEVPEEEFGSMGPNVLALAPRVVVAVDGSPETRRRMEAAGVDVSVFEGSEISHKGGRTDLPHPAVAPGLTRDPNAGRRGRRKPWERWS
jgi:N-dimethylarginine dimethylaminohydrolase